MANLLGDSEENRVKDRIKAIAFKEAKDAGASFITRKWVSRALGRTERWVQSSWNKR